MGVTHSVSFNPLFNWVASASMNSTVIVYDYQTSSVRHELKHDGGVIKLAWHPLSGRVRVPVERSRRLAHPQDERTHGGGRGA